MNKITNLLKNMAARRRLRWGLVVVVLLVALSAVSSGRSSWLVLAVSGMAWKLGALITVKSGMCSRRSPGS